LSTLGVQQARRLWLQAQRLDEAAPFGDGPQATRLAVEHLGYVQIDTINVVERCHHQILYTRIPAYRREHLRQAQSIDKTVFEYWTHALSYVPTRDLRFFLRAMRRDWRARSAWFGLVKDAEPAQGAGAHSQAGPLTIRDIDDDILVEKQHAWASRKPSKRALAARVLSRGQVTVSQRTGMLKTYELMHRHFGWERPPPAATEAEILHYPPRARATGASRGEPRFGVLPRPGAKPAIRRLLERKVRRSELVA
jgi:uncharacterized protein YcaQ